MKGVQCYELFGGIALKNNTFSFFIFNIEIYLTNVVISDIYVIYIYVISTSSCLCLFVQQLLSEITKKLNKRSAATGKLTKVCQICHIVH